MLAVFAVGCGGPPAAETDPQSVVEGRSASFRDVSPRDYLTAVFARYRNAASYHDRGVVRLGYQVDDRPQSKLAPMHIWLDHGQLYVEAYDVRIWSDAKSVMAWIHDPVSNHHDSQVLKSPPLSRRPTLETLLADPILAQRIAGGLAGPPPQLDWLFSGEPMKHLFHDTHQFEFASSRSIEGRMCRCVRVTAGAELYVFWIDERTGVIQRVDLPPVSASAAPGQSVQTMTLSLELVDATFDTPRRQPDIKLLPEQPKYVGQFVPLPPLEPARVLGSRLSAFESSEQAGKSELTVLVRFSGNQSSIVSAALIEHWHNSMPDSLRRRIRVAAVTDEHNTTIPPDLRLPIVIDQGHSIAQSLEWGPGAIAILDGDDSVAWIRPGISPHSSDELVQLGAVVADLLSGVDVPARIRTQWNEQVKRYRLLLDQSPPNPPVFHN